MLQIILTIIGILVPIIIAVLAANPYKKRREWREAELSNISSIFDNDVVELIKSKRFIPTMGQIDGPHNSDDVITISQRRFDLIKELLKDMLKPIKTIGKKRYVILGGTGMGKTTFSAALYYNYVRHKKLNRNPYPIFYFHLENNDVIEQINKINNDRISEATIILDALDESYEATKNYSVFKKNLDKATERFKVVIIICRTHFFLDKNNEPQKEENKQKSGQKEGLEYKTIYISPFSDDETNRYIYEKYKNDHSKYVKAKDIVNKSNDLMLRPLLLYYIDDLLDLDPSSSYISTIDIYTEIIDKWLERESNFLKSTEPGINEQDLYEFSKKIALYIYENRPNTKVSTIPYNNYLSFLSENGYTDSLSFSTRSLSTRSLINRDNNGCIKFAHRSFWEFFIAIISFEHPEKSFNPEGVKTAVDFSDELYELFIQGKINKYTKINPKSPIFLNDDFSDPIIRDVIDKAKQQHCSSRNAKAFDKSLCILWETLLRRGWSNTITNGYNLLLLNMLSKAKGYNDFTNEILPDGYTWQELASNSADSSVVFLQSYFSEEYNNENIKTLILHIEESINKYIKYKNAIESIALTDQLSSFITLDSFRSRNSNSETLITPSINKLDYGLFKRELSKGIVDIGYGFGDDGFVFNIINTIKEDYPKKRFINIYREGDNIDEHVRFILRLQELFKDDKISSVVQLFIGSRSIYYIISGKSRNDDENKIKCFITNMLKAKYD